MSCKLASKSFKEAVAAPFVDVKKVEEFTTFPVDDTPVHAVPDLIYRRGDDTWTIVDWKSGKTTGDDLDQLLVYALYVREMHGVRETSIAARIEHLAYGTASDYSVTQDDLDTAIDPSGGASLQ